MPTGPTGTIEGDDAQINGVDQGVDSFLPSDFPYPERLELLRQHEKSWNGLQFSLFLAFLNPTVTPFEPAI